MDCQINLMMLIPLQIIYIQLTIRFMPLPNATRWNSWFKMAFYVYEYIDYIRGFYKEEQDKESSETIDNIVSIFSDKNANGLNF